MTTSTALRPPTVPATPTRRPTTERALLVLEVLLAVGAYGGAVAFLLALEPFEPMRAHLPWESMVLAGVALGLVNGVLPTVVVVGTLQHRPWAGVGHLVVGVALVGWIVVQVAVMGWPPAVLQWIYLAYGLAITALAWRQRSRLVRTT